MMKTSKFFAAVVALLLSSVSFAETNQALVAYLQSQWEIDNYQLEGKAQKDAFKVLLEEADARLLEHPPSAELYIWRAIIKSSYAGIKGGIGALKYAKSAKEDLESALELDKDALQGSAFTSLGTLYFNVPGWPIGFGDDKKAEKFLTQALTINPSGIDSNYFYGDYLIKEKRYVEAKVYMEKAFRAAPRVGRELADKGRRAEVKLALQELERRL